MLANSPSPYLAELVEREGSLHESHIIEWPILNLAKNI
jgi:hypothetical protein